MEFSDKPDDFIRYLKGDTNIVISVPHGGNKKPPSIRERCLNNIPDGDAYRNIFSTTADANTIQLTEILADKIFSLSSCRPHVVINLLHRSRLDANRDKEIATCGNSSAEDVWLSFHEHIEKSIATSDKGLFIDIHGHKHSHQCIELGYCLSSESICKKSFSPSSSCLWNLAKQNNLQNIEKFDELLTGISSFGGLLQELKYDVLPSPKFPHPGKDYFAGGYNAVRYGLKGERQWSAIQIESPKHLRESNILESYATDLAHVICKFHMLYYTDSAYAFSE